MKVYHFVNKEFGLKDLREKRLKVSDILALNDPFEFYSLEMSDPEFRSSIKAAKHEVAKGFGVICFSANWKNPVQWAHYADKHKGLCLGFEVPEDCLEKVNYVNERTIMDGDLVEESVIKLLKTKYRDWIYEEEYRTFIPLEQPDDGLYYSDFSNKLKLVRVIVGAESSLSRSDIANAIGDNSEGIEVFKARPAFKTFEIVRNNNESLWL